jgi:hypothetical protein
MACSRVLNRFRYWNVPGPLLVLAACNSSHTQQPEQDPVIVEATRAETARAAELQQTVLAIESAPPDTLSEGQFYQVLDYHCGNCHFPVDYPSESVLGYFNNLHLLIQRGKVIPGDAESSPLVLRMRMDQVSPPAGWERPPVTDVAIDLIADFIDQLPLDSENPHAP